MLLRCPEPSRLPPPQFFRAVARQRNPPPPPPSPVAKPGIRNPGGGLYMASTLFSPRRELGL